MKRFIYIFLAIILSLTSCTEDNDMPADTESGEGVTILLQTQSMNVFDTRSDERIPADSRIDHVIIYAFDASDNKVGVIEQNLGEASIAPGNSTMPDGTKDAPIYYQLRALLKSNNITKLYAVCNYPELSSKDILRPADLNAIIMQGKRKKDCAFSDAMIMTGKVEGLTAADISNKNKPIIIPMKRIAARIDLDIKFAPYDTNDKFYLMGVEMHKIPLCSNLFESSSHAVAQGEIKDKFIEEAPLYVEDINKDEYKSRIYLYENWYERKEDSYFSSQHTDPEMYQTLKGKLGRDEYPRASFLRIKGYYTTSAGITRDVYYDIYIGENNYSDFSVKRNCTYKINATIKTVEKLDTRVNCRILNACDIKTAYKNPFDAHFGVGRCYAFTINKDWELYVEDPDQHPWLEISFSPNYRPRIAGHSIPAEEDLLYAGSRFEGKGEALSGFFYIHVDEFIPETAPEAKEDVNVEGGMNIALNPEKWRKGAVVLIDKVNGTTSRIEVTQRPAQLVRMPLKNVIGKPTGEYQEYFVEYELEQKNLIWGYLQYYDKIDTTMISLINDVTDGLSNTRKLYNVAVKPGGAYNNIKTPPFTAWDTPELAAANLPTDNMIGYAMTKNRDRNGNGCIDYNEIVWYVPAVDELLELWRVIEEGHLEIEDQEERFYSSTPSAGGATEEVPGRAYYVKTKKNWWTKKDEKVKAFVMRDHKYNVICCRRKNAWRDSDNSDINGGIGVDPNWGGSDDVIIGGTPDKSN